jgi:uncharacterized membrane-anchored protein YhcB (DUF1043 family)
MIDDVLTWTGRIWSAICLASVAGFILGVMVGAVRGRLIDRRERKADVERVRQLARQMFTQEAVDEATVAIMERQFTRQVER